MGVRAMLKFYGLDNYCAVENFLQENNKNNIKLLEEDSEILISFSEI